MDFKNAIHIDWNDVDQHFNQRASDVLYWATTNLASNPADRCWPYWYHFHLAVSTFEKLDALIQNRESKAQPEPCFSRTVPRSPMDCLVYLLLLFGEWAQT